MTAAVTDTPRTTTSWALATWVVPVVPALWALVFLLVGSSSDLADTQAGGYGAGLGLALIAAAVGAGLTRVGGAAVRGLGWGLMAGGLACAVPSLWVLLT